MGMDSNVQFGARDHDQRAILGGGRTGRTEMLAVQRYNCRLHCLNVSLHPARKFCRGNQRRHTAHCLK